MADFLGSDSWFFASEMLGRKNMKPYPPADDLLRPILGLAMPRGGRLYVPGGTAHVVARCNNREFYFTTPADFEVLLAHLGEMLRTYEVTLYAYTLMPNHLPCSSKRRGSTLVTFHPSYLALSPYPKVRQRCYRTVLLPSPDPRLDARDARWSSQRAVGSPAFLERHIPRRGRRKSVFLPPEIQALGS